MTEHPDPPADVPPGDVPDVPLDDEQLTGGVRQPLPDLGGEVDDEEPATLRLDLP